MSAPGEGGPASAAADGRAHTMPFTLMGGEACMSRAMDDIGVASLLFDRLLASLHGTAGWMRSRDG